MSGQTVADKVVAKRAQLQAQIAAVGPCATTRKLLAVDNRLANWQARNFIGPRLDF